MFADLTRARGGQGTEQNTEITGRKKPTDKKMTAAHRRSLFGNGDGLPGKQTEGKMAPGERRQRGEGARHARARWDNDQGKGEEDRGARARERPYQNGGHHAVWHDEDKRGCLEMSGDKSMHH